MKGGVDLVCLLVMYYVSTFVYILDGLIDVRYITQAIVSNKLSIARFHVFTRFSLTLLLGQHSHQPFADVYQRHAGETARKRHVFFRFSTLNRYSSSHIRSGK